jgi:hypothetical protein
MVVQKAFNVQLHLSILAIVDAMISCPLLSSCPSSLFRHECCANGIAVGVPIVAVLCHSRNCLGYVRLTVLAPLSRKS